MSRIALTTMGSLGDLHPYLALGIELRGRGHAVTLATHSAHRQLAIAAGLAFAPVRPDFQPLHESDDVLRRAMDLRTGSEYIVREFVLKPLRESTADLLVACAGSDLVVGHVLSVAAALAAERLGVPRAHAVLQPLAMWSAQDPPVPPALPAATFLRRRLPPPVWRVLWAAGRRWTRGWREPVNALRRELGLARTRAHPLLDLWSPHLNLALFSPRFAPPQSDWPPRTVATGFPEWISGEGLDAPLEAFLAAGEPPVVFTLGSAAVHAAGDFWRQSRAAIERLGCRAVLLVGSGRHAPPADPGDRRVQVREYAPHAALFPRAAAIVHQGGIGTTARALASGRPMLVVPYSHDQPDNAARCERMGVARVLSRNRYAGPRAAEAVAALLSDRGTLARAASMGAAIAGERGAAAAADAIERVLDGRLVTPAGPS
jgi:rhamnosyltransferase subunit B